MKKLTIVMLLLVLASFSFAQAGSLIGIAMPETHVARWVKDGNQLKAEAEKKGYRAVVQWANADQPTQNQQIQSFLTQGAKVLIVGNLNTGVNSVIAQAKKDKVAVIAYDRIIQQSKDYDYFITFNNYKVGTLQGEAIRAALNLSAASAAAPKYITLFAGSPTDDNANFFFDGAYDVLKPYINSGALKVVGPHPKGSADKGTFLRITTEGWYANIAKARMEGLLVGDASGVKLDAVLAPNDPIARAVIEALRADAKYQGANLPVVTGQDAEFDSIMSIKNGQQNMTVFKDTAKLAEAAILLADGILKGAKNITIPGAVLAGTAGTNKNIGNNGAKVVTTYLLDPIAVNRSNLSVPVNAGFYTDAENAQINR